MDLYQSIFDNGLQLRRQAESSINAAVKLQLRQALASCGITLNIDALSLFTRTAGSDVLVTELHAEVKENFTLTLNAYQGHFRRIEKLQKQLVQPRDALAKAKTRYDEIDAQLKKAGEDAPEKLKGQLAAANGQLLQAQARFDPIQAEIDAEFAAARDEDLEPFLRARRADEYTRLLFRVIETPNLHWDDAALRALQASINATHIWNPAYAK